jgi:hypothetical protein
VARELANRHYSRQNPDADQFVAPGRCLVLLAGRPASAVWVTSWPFAELVRHGHGDAWVCTLFRNEGAGLSSELIREAVAATRWRWPAAPPLMLTFVDATKVRHKRDPGRCFRRAGFVPAGFTRERGHLVLALELGLMPPPEAPEGAQEALFPPPT